jgi:UDP-N-acetyl-D-glucosamine/UDP-N-acetyl-D-galactosamine dehydrogenase
MRLVVIGLGYVGLPLAVTLSSEFKVIGYDISPIRIDELNRGYDRTDEISCDRLAASSLVITAEQGKIANADVYIVAVPTPVDEFNTPDLAPLKAACNTVGSVMTTGSIVVFESTVYPGVTEEVCGPAIEKASGLVCGVDFFLGYSPERINPGDKDHTIENIVKVVAGQTPAVAQKLADMYGKVISAGTFTASDIRTAEAAKVIENAQRDINIAFINEISVIFNKLGISAYEVLEAAGTKWNFLPFQPGLVGGHCIGVDPFYLAHKAKEVGYYPEVILAGRKINDAMGDYVAAAVADAINVSCASGPILVLGLTFKENVPDLRNTKVVDVIAGLKVRGFDVEVHDPFANAAEAKAFFSINLHAEIPTGPFACVLGAVPHESYRSISANKLTELVIEGGVVADIKGMWRDVETPSHITRWQL